MARPLLTPRFELVLRFSALSLSTYLLTIYSVNEISVAFFNYSLFEVLLKLSNVLIVSG